MTLDIRNVDCMKLMKEYPDKWADLAIVDPPYGINRSNNFGSEKFRWKQYKRNKWDNKRPSKLYFKELFRVSRNQIIWGGNYFTNYLFPSMGWIVWDKLQENFSTSDCELAFSSFNRALRRLKLARNILVKEDLIHPTQKPITLYEWLLIKYAKKGDKILDTHMGSGSIAIACHNLGFDLTACELDKDYYEAAMKRINHHVRQKPLFNLQEIFINP